MEMVYYTSVTSTSSGELKETDSDIPNLAERVSDYFKQLGYVESFILSRSKESVWVAYRSKGSYKWSTKFVSYDELAPQISEEDLWE